MTQLVNGSQMGSWSGYPRYVYLSGDVTRSGNTVTLSNLSFYFTASNAYASGYSETIEIKNGGTTISSTGTVWTFSGGTSPTISLNNGSFTVSTSATSVTLTLTASGDSVNFSVSFPAGSTSPTGLAAANIAPLTNGFSATVSVTDWGTGGSSDPSAHYKELSIFNYNSLDTSPNRKNKVNGTNLSDTIVTDNNNFWTGSLNIAPNTRYTLGIYATNGNDPQHGQTGIGDYVTLAEAPTVTAGTATHNSIELNYSQSADGGANTKYIEYSLDGTTWVTGATLTSGAAATGTFTITGLSPATAYSIQTRTRTVSGSSAGPTLSVTTARDVKLYGSANNQTEEVQKLYGSVNGQTKFIKKLYGSVNGLTKLIYRG